MRTRVVLRALRSFLFLAARLIPDFEVNKCLHVRLKIVRNKLNMNILGSPCSACYIIRFGNTMIMLHEPRMD
jgi:hypothetical protein